MVVKTTVSAEMTTFNHEYVSCVHRLQTFILRSVCVSCDVSYSY